MRIIQFTDCYFPTINGVCSSIKSLVYGLFTAGFEVLTVAPKVPQKSCIFFENKIPETVEKENGPEFVYFSSIVLPQLKDNRLGFPWPLAVWSKIKSFAPEVVHVHTPGPIGLMGLIYARLYKLPCVFTHHTLFEEYLTYFPFPQNMSKRLILAWMKLFLNGSSLVIAPSKKVSQRLLEQGYHSSIRVIPSGLNVSSFRNGDGNRLKEELKLNDKPFLYVGRIAYEKSINLIIESFSKLIEKLKNSEFFLEKQTYLPHLVLIGDGPARKNLEEIVNNLGLSSLVHFLGWRRREELKDYYASSLAFVFASITETQGLTVAEAEAAGLPVIAVKAGGVDEALPPDSFLGIEKQDSDKLAYLMEELWKDRRKASELGSLASEFIENNFSDKKILSVYKDLYDSLCVSKK
ncbi:MAG: glycosyltransferase [Candidatus Bruticola sp.]